MNRSFLNGGPLNGSSFAAAVVLAAATIAGSSSVSAAAVRSTDALAPVFSGAQISANPEVKLGGFATPSGVASVLANATHTKQAQSAVAGTVSVTAFVLRNIHADAEIVGSAQMLVIPASVIGNSAISGGATVSAQATRVQPGRTTLGASGTVTITSAPVVSRFVVANISGSSAVRVESAVNGVLDSYSNIVGTASLTTPTSGFLFRYVSAELISAAFAVGTGTRVQFAEALMPVSSSVTIGAVTAQSGVAATIAASASATADAVRVLRGVANVTAAAQSLQAAARQRHAAQVAFSGNSQFTASPTLLASTGAVFSGVASTQATATRVLPVSAAVASAAQLVARANIGHAASAAAVGTCVVTIDADTAEQGAADLAGSATMTAQALLFEQGFASVAGAAAVSADAKLAEQGQAAFAGTVAFTASALRTAFGGATVSPASVALVADATRVVVGSAAITGQVASLQADASAFKPASAAISGTVQVIADGGKVILAQAAAGGTCVVVADTVTNAASFDPAERTFNRQAYQSTFIKPELVTEFRRAV